MYRNFIWMFWSFSKSFICFLFGSLLVCLCMLLLAYARSSGVRSLLLRIFRVQRTSARQVHTLIILFNTQFLLCISFTLKDCMSRIGNMWLLLCSWWGRNLLPLITPGIYVMLINCLAMLVDGDWYVRFMKVARDNN